MHQAQRKPILSLLLILGLLAGMLAPLSAQEDDSSDVMALIAGNRGLSTLAEALALTGLDEPLAATEGITVFAPINLVFDSLPPGALEALLADPATLSAILQQHVVVGSFSAADLQDGMELNTLTGETLTVSISDGAIRVGEARLLQQDLQATNGLVHTINAVLLPSGISLPAAQPESAAVDEDAFLAGNPDGLPTPSMVGVPGTHQDEAGCPGEWQPECESTLLSYDEASDLWRGTFDLPAGSYMYKVALNGSWDANYGQNAEPGGADIPLELAADSAVTFVYNHNTGWITEDASRPFAWLTGDFQDELGCPTDNAPDCQRAWLEDPDGDGSFSFVTPFIPAGDYSAQALVAGETVGEVLSFNVPADSSLLTFTVEPATSSLSVEVGEVVSVVEAGAAAEATEATEESPDEAAATGPSVEVPQGDVDPAGVFGLFNPQGYANPESVTIAGTLQDELGCPNEWAPECELSFLSYDPAMDVWTGTFDLPAGSYEYKAALNSAWDENYGAGAVPGGDNIPLLLESDRSVSFFYDHKSGYVTDDVNSIVATLPGSYQSELGCPALANDGDWEPGCLRTLLTDPDGDGIYTYMTPRIPAGTYEVKVAIDRAWDENYGLDGAGGGANIPFEVPADRTLMVFAWDADSKVLSIEAGGNVALTDAERSAHVIAAGGVGNLTRQRAYWLNENTIAWDVNIDEGNQYFLHYSPTAALSAGESGVEGGESIPLTLQPEGLPAAVLAKFPHLRNLAAFTLADADLELVRDILKGQIAVSAVAADGTPIDATGLQIPGVLDALYSYYGDLGVTFFTDGTPTLRVWAPTAQNVTFHLFEDADPATESSAFPMEFDPVTGVWSILGDVDWLYQYYLFEVDVFVPATGAVEKNFVTDPYSFSLSANSSRSQIVDLNDPALKPEGWDDFAKPDNFDAPEDIVIYELHIRDFSMNDASVPQDLRGTYLAFTLEDSNGVQHLRRLESAGLTHLHLLPSFDIATTDEIAANRTEIPWETLAEFAPDSEEQQALISDNRDNDGFNWGYDPFHYTTPEGSYATDPNGAQRILEYRQMVMALNELGLNVVQDVVYNHTNAAGLAEKSVLDKIVPGYYYRLSGTGSVESSTCCPNTATEHNMMRKLMVDSLLTWATHYKIDGFRFDLMGHHMLADMLEVQQALSHLTVADDGVDGRRIYIYGEGWNFGEVADNARGINATQINLAGTGIGTFSDRLRDAVRGGSPVRDSFFEQGFVSGIFLQPNAEVSDLDAEMERLLLFADQIRVGLAGNLAGYPLIDATGAEVLGADIPYGNDPTGYTADPQEHIVYIEKHDNQTLFDWMLYKVPDDMPLADIIRLHHVGSSFVMFSQGVPFFQAGQEMLRSKSMDRNSYNSGDWFNRLDFSYQHNNFGVGLPLAGDNQAAWDFMRPILARADELTPSPEQIEGSVAYFEDLLRIRQASPLFRLRTATDVIERLAFHNTGPDQQLGLIVMSLDDSGDLSDLDPGREMILVIFNTRPEEVSFTDEAFAGMGFSLHELQANGSDEVVKAAAFDDATGTFSVPAYTTAVFEVRE